MQSVIFTLEQGAHFFRSGVSKLQPVGQILPMKTSC